MRWFKRKCQGGKQPSRHLAAERVTFTTAPASDGAFTLCQSGWRCSACGQEWVSLVSFAGA